MHPAPIEWEDGKGRHLWQPVRSDGARYCYLRTFDGMSPGWTRHWQITAWTDGTPISAAPVLYRSYRRALRVALRASRRHAKATVSRVEEVGNA